MRDFHEDEEFEKYLSEPVVESEDDEDDEWLPVPTRSYIRFSPVKSASAYLRSTTPWWERETKKQNERDSLLEILKELNKTVNLTQNSESGKSEANLTVRFSSGGNTNDLLSNVLYVSPDLMRDSKGKVLEKGDDYYGSLDALNGQAMLCSFMMKGVDKTYAARDYIRCNNWSIRNLYMTDLQKEAVQEITDSWPGFESYMVEQKRRFNLDKQAVLASFAGSEVGIDEFVNLLCYNLLSQDKIDYSTYFTEDLAQRLLAAEHLLRSEFETEIESKNRFQRSAKLFNELQTMLDLTVPPPALPPACDMSEESDENEEDGASASGSASGSGDESDDESAGAGASGSDDDEQKFDIQGVDLQSASALSRKYTGDSSFNDNLPVSNEVYDQLERIDPNEQLKEKMKVEQDKLSCLQDEILQDVNYQRMIPAVNDLERLSYKKIKAESRRAIDTVRDCFQFHNTDTALRSHGLTAGMIDENNLHKVYMGEYERLYERQNVMSRRKWLVGLLMDQSDSMNTGRTGCKIVDARKLTIIMSEALSTLQDLDYCVYGFTNENRSIQTFVYKDREVNKLSALSTARGLHATSMGYSVAHAGDKMLSQYPTHENRILFVITDGEPTSTSNSSMRPVEHTRRSIELLRRRGIHVYGIGVQSPFKDDVGNALFGENQYCILPDVNSALPVLVNRVRNFLKRMQK